MLGFTPDQFIAVCAVLCAVLAVARVASRIVLHFRQREQARSLLQEATVDVSPPRLPEPIDLQALKDKRRRQGLTEQKQDGVFVGPGVS